MTHGQQETLTAQSVDRRSAFRDGEGGMVLIIRQLSRFAQRLDGSRPFPAAISGQPEGSPERGPCHIPVQEDGTAQIGAGEVRSAHVGAPKIGAAQIDSRRHRRLGEFLGTDRRWDQQEQRSDSDRSHHLHRTAIRVPEIAAKSSGVTL